VIILSEQKKAAIREAIRQLHAGVPPEQVKEKFREVFEGTDSLEIAKIEEELADEGIKREQMRKLCEVHMAIFKEQLEKQVPKMKPSQPISILMEEHKIMLQMADKLVYLTNKILKVTEMQYVIEDIHQVEHVAEDFTDAEKHYVREENVLFPMVEKHGITEPPAIMWMEHDQIREQKKRLHKLITDLKTSGFEVFKKQLWETSKALSTLLQNHFYKENNVLFPAAMSIVTNAEWIDVRKEFDDIGYCCFTPPALTLPTAKEKTTSPVAGVAGALQLDTGNLSNEQLEALFNTLPFELTFVDADDTVPYSDEKSKNATPKKALAPSFASWNPSNRERKISRNSG
jgi:DUF438 domain-containing protein